ncbi:lipolytic protein G-D-S-L family [Fibrisoma limi BUZ 3]|uniref:Lipolytic protein G-D-S-L family n=1 Tax=Fibrisoma limi BUZ 3 TaxID=1185876 RepID=I2GNX5_9BACT|nr:SGNH/GDSL hydrolase family protein [Fibrisoma limi]CCH55603.1 lipolytic protein G-D-S-L family [Fibrisoma limi BUZ 3]
MKQTILRQGVLLVAILCLFGSFEPRALTWVAIGDSITYLNDHQNETGNRITKGYMTRVVEKLPHLRYVNQGHNGWTAVRIAQQIENLGLVKADLYSIFLGTNDWWGGRPLGRFQDYQTNTGNGTVYGAFRQIIDKVRSLNPQAPIILITPMQRVDFVYIANLKNNAYGSYRPKNGQSLESFATAIDSIGRYEKIPVVDLYHLKGLAMSKLVKFKRLKDPQTGQYVNYPYPTFIDVPFNPETDEYPYPVESIRMTYDGLHPSDRGYALISRQLVKVLKRID